MPSLITDEDRLNIRNIFTDKYNKLVTLSQKYVLYLVLDIIKRSNIQRLLDSGFISAAQITKELNFISKSELPIYWLLSYLKDFGYVETKQINGISCFMTSDIFPYINYDEVREEMIRIDRNVIPSNMLLERAAEGYMDFFRGNKTAVDLLITGDRMKLWTEYFNNTNSGYVVHNAFAALGLIKWFPERENIEILEIGGGTGSAAIFFLNEIQIRGLTGRIGKYIFSDISPVMLRVGNKAFMETLQDDRMIQLKALDFNKSFKSQGIDHDSMDIIYGVNSIHAAEDIEYSMQNIYNALKPGGVLILSECVRSGRNGLLFQEIIFNLFDNYREMKLSEARPVPGFIDIKSWIRLLGKAEFKKVELLTNVDSDSKKSSKSIEQVFAMVIKGEK